MLFVDQVKLVISSPVEIYIYADDVKFMTSAKSDCDKTVMQNALNDFCDWAYRMGLKLSAEKCTVLHLGQETPNLTIN